MDIWKPTLYEAQSSRGQCPSSGGAAYHAATGWNKQGSDDHTRLFQTPRDASKIPQELKDFWSELVDDPSSGTPKTRCAGEVDATCKGEESGVDPPAHHKEVEARLECVREFFVKVPVVPNPSFVADFSVAEKANAASLEGIREKIDDWKQEYGAAMLPPAARNVPCNPEGCGPPACCSCAEIRV
jgi:hypothetical protein